MIKNERTEISKIKKEAKYLVIVQINCTLTYTTTDIAISNLKYYFKHTSRQQFCSKMEKL